MPRTPPESVPTNAPRNPPIVCPLMCPLIFRWGATSAPTNVPTNENEQKPCFFTGARTSPCYSRRVPVPTEVPGQRPGRDGGTRAAEGARGHISGHTVGAIRGALVGTLSGGVRGTLVVTPPTLVVTGRLGVRRSSAQLARVESPPRKATNKALLSQNPKHNPTIPVETHHPNPHHKASPRKTVQSTTTDMH